MTHDQHPCPECDVAEPARPSSPTPLSLPRQTGPGLGERADRLATDVQFVRCPECGSIASVEWSSTAPATHGGPVGHAKVRCVTGHWFLLPTVWLTPA